MKYNYRFHIWHNLFHEGKLDIVDAKVEIIATEKRFNDIRATLATMGVDVREVERDPVSRRALARA